MYRKMKGRKKEILKDVLAQRPWLYEYLNEECKSDRELCKAAFQEDGSMLEYAAEPVKSDKELVMIAVGNGDALTFACEDLQCDKEVILCALEYDDGILDSLGDEFLEDLDIMYKAVYIFPENYTYFSEELQEDRDVALACVKIRGEVYEFLCEELRQDEEIAAEAIKHGADLSLIDNHDFLGNYEIIASAIKNNGGDQLLFASDDLRDNGKLVEFALENGLSRIRALGRKMHQDKQLIKKIVRNISLDENRQEEKVLEIMYLPKELLQDDDFILELIQENELVFHVICKEAFIGFVQRSIPYNQDAVFCQRAYDVNRKMFKYMGNAMKKNIKK